MNRRGASPVLVGRAAEMAALEAALRAVRQGEPSAVLVGGEAGMGKTRLIGEFSARAADAGIHVLSGACMELGAEGLPFTPFTAMLRDLVRRLGASEIAGLLAGHGGAARELARLLPELAYEQAGGGTDPDAGRNPWDRGGAESLTAGEARAQLFEGFLTLLERLAERRPVALIVEDAHWADRSSRDLLSFLIGYQRGLRDVLIVVTFRSDELHRTHPLRPLLAELGRIEWVDRMELPRLSRGEAEELATAFLGYAPDRVLAESIYLRAEGNPLFTEELLHCGGSCGCDMVPGTLADLLLQAVRRLPDDAQEVLRVASAGGGVTSDALLAQVTGRSPVELAAAIRPAVAANVLVPSVDGYVFRHALIREAVHEDLLPGEHAAVHTRFARAIEADPSLASPGRVDIEKSHHWYSAHNAGEALAASWRASVQASNAVAHAERLMLLDRVLELWDQVPDAAARIAADHVRVLEEAVRAARDAGEHARGLALCELALAELDESAEPVRVALLLSRRWTFRRDLGGGPAPAEVLRALDLVPASLSRQARTQVLLAAFHCAEWSDARFHPWTEEALCLAREAGDRTAEAEALAMMAMSEAGHGQLALPGSDPLRLLAQAKQVAATSGAFHPALMLVIYESHLLCGAGQFEQAAQVARQGITDAERHGLARYSGAFLAINLAEPLYWLGRLDEADKVAERALGHAPPPLTRAGLWIVRGWIATARGDLDAAARCAASSRAVLSTAAHEDQFHLPQAQLDIAITLAAEGPVAAVATADQALRWFDLSAASPRYAWPLLVTAATAARQVPGADAEALFDRLSSLAEKLDVHGPVQRAWQLWFAALSPAPADEDSGGRGTWQAGSLAAADAAVAAWESAGQPYQAAVLLIHAARIAIASRSPHEATVRLRRAADIAELLGARPLADEIAGLARQADGDADGPSLTFRELEVLRLVAAGQSNREIAAALVISPKTVSVHVSNILAKLGAATRTEAAVRAQRMLLLDVPGAG